MNLEKMPFGYTALFFAIFTNENFIVMKNEMLRREGWMACA
jgi:hypothetical protein